MDIMKRLFKRILFVSNTFKDYYSLIEDYLSQYEVLNIKEKKELDKLEYLISADDLIICYNTGIIINENILRVAGKAINIHAASPQFPGRDPHHWAIYEDAKEYGATAHYMTSKVDEGAIIKIKSFDIPSNCTPKLLKQIAIEHGNRLLEEVLQEVLSGKEKVLDIQWNGKKRTRAMFFEKCNIPIDIDKTELEKRIFSFSVENKKNIYLLLNNHKFYLEE